MSQSNDKTHDSNAPSPVRWKRALGWKSSGLASGPNHHMQFPPRKVFGFQDSPSQESRPTVKIEDVAQEDAQPRQVLAEHTHALLTYTNDVIFVLTGGGGIQYQSPSTQRVLGYENQSLIGKSCFDLIHPDDTPEMLQAFGSLMGQPDQHRPCSFRFWHQSGLWRIMEGSLHNQFHHKAIGGVVLSIHDVTENKETEEQLRNSEGKNRALLEAIPDLMFCIDPKGRVTAFKESLAGWTPTREAPPNQRKRHVVHAPHELIAFIQTHAKKVFANHQAALLECRLEMPDQHIDYEIRVVEGGHGEVLAIVRDITERNRLHYELMQANRMAELGTLAASVGHEINNPLTYIVGHLEEVHEQLSHQNSYSSAHIVHWQELLREALEGSNRIAAIVRDLKTYTRQETDESDHVNLHHTLDKALQMAANQVLQNAQLHRDYHPIPYVYAVQSRLEQVFLNLIVNAAQAMSQSSGPPSLLLIQTEYDETHHQVMVSVTDNGAGIPSDKLSVIFEPFFTTKPIGSGTGLGLFVCRNIVESFGGRLSVQSLEGHGSTFTVTLPAAGTELHTHQPLSLRRKESKPHETQALPHLGRGQLSAAVSSPSNPIPAQLHLNDTVLQGTPPPPTAMLHDQPSTSILIIDDEPRVAQSLRRILRGHQITIANAGRHGLEECLKHNYRLVFCDVLMPDLTGQEVYEAASRQRPEYQNRFVFMTGGAFTEQTREFCQTVERPLLEKPFNRKAIRKMVEELLSESSTR
ncbi:MAG: PAS domain S-box protein [Deltaproteobacteria bacterium]|nr:MAG: PAS domain S-box protein [Deltaproteobacteria bacterium]